MILYFSATGNCKYVAEQIALSLSDEAKSILDVNKDLELKEDEVLGIITPTNWLELPILTRMFIRELTVKSDNTPYVFLVSTYGTTPGFSGKNAKKEFKKRGIELSAAFSVRMPDNYTPIFDLSNKDKVNKQLEEADKELLIVIERIKNRKLGNNQDHKYPYILKPFFNAFSNYQRKTKHLHVNTDLCIGCTLCEKKCPIKAIKMEDKHPVWTEKRCAMCLGCLHRCPKHAIYYGNGKDTNSHGQYKHPKTEL